MRVFDCFRFFNELDILEMRLNILNDVVDYFVISECPYTISGNEKPLYYLENKERFEKFNHKIVHHILDEIPNNFSDYIEKKPLHTAYSDIDVNCGMPYIEIPIRYQRDMYARNCAAYGLIQANIEDDDIVITSDADEIINPKVLEDLSWFNPNNHYHAIQRAFYFKLNYLYQENWFGSCVCNWKYLKERSIDKLRADRENAYKIEDSGWHWSFFGDADKFRSKMASYGDYHLNVPEITNNIEEKIEKGLDPLGRSNILTTVPLDDSFPEYILDNQDKYVEFIKPWN
jgi:beta-1,4-mannosyl-glycoprotein beta-1,4-N-acetylglucosaminyltransferase